MCKGNICRSPLAARVLSDWLALNGASNLAEIRSRGTENFNIGRGADKHMMVVATRHGVDLSSHVASQANPDDIAWSDLVIVMDSSNRNRLWELFGSLLQTRDMRRLREFTGESDMELTDPYKLGEEAYEIAFLQVRDGTVALGEWLVKSEPQAKGVTATNEDASKL